MAFRDRGFERDRHTYGQDALPQRPNSTDGFTDDIDGDPTQHGNLRQMLRSQPPGVTMRQASIDPLSSGVDGDNNIVSVDMGLVVDAINDQQEDGYAMYKMDDQDEAQESLVRQLRLRRGP